MEHDMECEDCHPPHTQLSDVTSTSLAACGGHHETMRSKQEAGAAAGPELPCVKVRRCVLRSLGVAAIALIS